MSSGNVKRKSNDSRVGSPAKRNRPVNQDKEWNQKFFELMLYRAEHGNILVKDSDENHKSLYKWITQQRKDYRRFTENPEGCILNNDRIKVLKSVNFTFGTRNDKNWLYHFDQLKQFKEKYGHTLVPRESEFHGLGGWVVKQRMQQGLTNDDNESEMSQDRKDMLDSLGFVWQVRDRPGWDSRYEELVEFKKQHGHTVSRLILEQIIHSFWSVS